MFSYLPAQLYTRGRAVSRPPDRSIARCLTVCVFRTAFLPLLAWQRRLWLTVGEFLSSAPAPAAPAAGTPAGAPSAAELVEQEDSMREERNYFVRTVTHNFQETHQLSVAIARLQGLTTALRVSWWDSTGVVFVRNDPN